MIELVNGIHHYPVTTYSVDPDGVVVAHDLYPHKVRERLVAVGLADPHRLCGQLTYMNSLGGNPLIA